MTESNTVSSSNEDLLDEDLLAVYGEPTGVDGLESLTEKRRDFKPWHHPVKQIVRSHQWAALTQRLIQARPQGASHVLKYFTLPGADLLDVRVIAEVCEPLGVKIEYFGFDAGSSSSDEQGENGENSRDGWITAESALLQAGRITPNAVILADRLEDIALPGSQAAAQLGQRTSFDVINIDACDHLAYCPRGREFNTFNALEVLLRHQMRAHSPWLLFITTRAEPSLLGQPGIVFQNAITQNLGIQGSDFGASLANCLQADEFRLAAELATIWGRHDSRFLQLYSIGLGKFLLQFFHGQPNLPANVELASVYAYRVYGEHPDMLALAFRITPDTPRVFAPNVGGAAVIPNLEPARASYVARQAEKLQDLDRVLETEEGIRNAAVDGTKTLLESASYDVTAWSEWLAGHIRRPMVIA